MIFILHNRLSESAEEIFAKSGGLTFIQKAATSTERPLRLCAARLMLRLSHYPDLLPLIHRSGIVYFLVLQLWSRFKYLFVNTSTYIVIGF